MAVAFLSAAHIDPSAQSESLSAVSGMQSAKDVANLLQNQEYRIVCLQVRMLSCSRFALIQFSEKSF